MRFCLIATTFAFLFMVGAPMVSDAKLPDRPELAIETAQAPSTTTQLDQFIQTEMDLHPGQSGFNLVKNGEQAFALRAMSAHLAERSLDVQYYIWHNDTTGRLLARELLMAANRGVKVRLLLDDLDARSNNFALASLDAHPNIQVRIFNPFNSRKGVFGKMWESLTQFKRINHRMHNKNWIADNRIAIAGGRNIGDEYFDASDEVNFYDLDYAIIGPAVETLSTSFDKYWNSITVYPMTALSPELVNSESLAQLEANATTLLNNDLQSPYVKVILESGQFNKIIQQQKSYQWTSEWEILSDDPLKALKDKNALQRSNVLSGFIHAVNSAESSIDLISPYFVPGKNGTTLLTDAQANGRTVSVLTNSLAANDVVAVHGGYSKYRKPLLKGGVKLYELKPSMSAKSSNSWFGSSGASLHAKSGVFDHQNVYVGSFNLDPRSVSLNCEQGIMVKNSQLGQQMLGIFNTVTQPQYAWQVTLDKSNHLTWTDQNGIYTRDPEAKFSKRFKAFLTRILPIESQL